MPDPRIKRPLPALLGEFDASPYVGDVFTRQPTGSTTTTATIPSTAGRYWDLIAFLNGYGSKSGETMEDIAADTWGGPNPIKFGIDSNDRFFTECVDDFSLKLQFASSWSDLGYEPTETRATQVTNFGVTTFRVTAPNPWRRGVFQLESGISVIRHASQGDQFENILNSDNPRVQSLPTFLRKRGSMNDADDVWAGQTLEDFDPQSEARWLVEPDGRVTVNYYERFGFGFTDPLGTNLWYRLGGTGLETPTNGINGRKSLTTAHPCPCVLASPRGYVNFRRETRMRETRQMMTDGSIVSSGLPVLRNWRLTMRIDGPALGAESSQEQHLRQWWSYARGALTLYPSFGDADRPPSVAEPVDRFGCGGIDTRRHINARDASRDWFRYTLLHTAGADADEVHYLKRQGGRLLVRLHPSDDQTRRESYGESKDIFQDIDFILADDPGR